MRFLYFDLPNTGKVKKPGDLKTDEILKQCGGNTGNLLFRYAISRHIEDELVGSHWSDGL